LLSIKRGDLKLMKIPHVGREACVVPFFALSLLLACAPSAASDTSSAHSASKADTRVTSSTETATQSNSSVTLPPRSAVRFPNASEVIVNRAAPEPEAAPAAPVPRIPGAITTLAVQNTAQYEQFSVPITFGQAFVQGDLRPADLLGARLPDGAVLPVQLDVKASYRDGSVKHAVISLVLPKLEGGKVQYFGLVKVPRGTPQAMPGSKT
jgi:hypothetical protein